ncbi:MAG TPA: DNA-3-methyladenine glycosylase [Pirellulaceae bacterium]|nr:DNA-3-methyladenine glycosylase [Pirellulaceae bacterium]HMO91031.1 DNA-3-methyladenine glycosylase [Pirellulaceae bacterium]HMP68146.1 DNA-3-methyladenine glycosylase [Pirellulaceae bacterium]
MLPTMHPPRVPLPRSFFLERTEHVAPAILGKALIRRIGEEIVGGIIVETEAYLDDNDPACHAYRGLTPRNRVMFHQGGHLYVYSIHAKHCLNVVTGAANAGCAVLIRALQPVWGIPKMCDASRHSELRRLTNGPAKLCRALSVTTAQNGLDLTLGEEIWLAEFDFQWQNPWTVRTSPRIGISQAQDLPLRFFIDRNRFVSGPASSHSGQRNQEIPIV